MTWILAQLVQNALKMLAVVAGIFFLGGWAWFAYFQGRDWDARSVIPVAHDGLTHHKSASVLPGQGGGDTPDPESYARQVFGKMLPIQTVLASKSAGEGVPGCSYAIIRTGTGIARTPPTSALGTAPWARFGGDWRQTPERVFGTFPVDALAECRGEWQAGLADELQQVLDGTGNWYMRSASGEDLHIYSAEGRVAARIRHGS
ncbi:hypothetical protein [Salipiger mangrovisoli]|uniref:Lipoprotein n=1 Tax=Salipiger mangrovisoli TaxID=2865933 RepID=A0ABR9X793_9RHOB|nr:hypothetical protein [Salipiger mangrovisoli]MBE9639413.1 hypothetical protein [Salipiger mangrovisoli]